MEHRTFIALYRSLLYNGHFRLPHIAFKIFIYLLIKATRFPNTKMRLEVGECWVSYADIQADCSEGEGLNLSQTTVSKMLSLLENSGYIKRKVTQGIGMKIRIVNYRKYQETQGVKAVTSPNNGVASGEVSGVANGDIQESTKKVNKESSSPKLKFTEEQMTLAIYFRTLLLERKPDMKITGSAEKWANEIRLAVEQDKRTLERIKAVMIWANADSFWQNNVLSISALRKNFDALELRMEKTNKKQPEKKKPRER